MSDISKIKVGETTYDIKDQAGREAFANSKVMVLDATSDTDHIPVAKTVYDYGQTIKQYFDNAKTTQISANSTDQYVPTAKAVYEYIQANGGSGDNGNISEGATASSGYNLGDYYAVNTIHVIPEMIPEDADNFEGMYRVSDYTNKDVLFHIEAMIENQTRTSTGYLVNLAAAEDFPFPMYMLVSELPVMLLPEDIAFSEETQDPETGAITTEEVKLSAGIYCPPFQMIISCLEKREKYLVQETISFNANTTPMLNQFFKSSDNTDIDGLYSVLAITGFAVQGESISLSFGYASGGYFKPISYFEPELALSTIYALEGNLEPGSIASIIVTEETVIPEEFTGIAFTVEPGTYLAKVEDTPYLELVKLQEKEMELKLDQFIGKDSNGLTVLEALLSGLDQSEAGEFNLVFNGNTQGEEKNIKKVYGFFRTAYDKNGQIIVSLSGEQGYVTFKMRPHLINFGGSLVATASGSLFTDGAWLDTAFQIAVFESGIEVYSKVKAQI